MTRPILRIQGLTKRFGGLTAVKDFDLEIEEGEIRAIVGPNGAGKTTLFNCIGFYKPDKGRILFKEKDITNIPAHGLIKLGISRTFQITNIFPKLSVYENVRVAYHSAIIKGFKMLSISTKGEEEINDLLMKIGLYEKRNELAKNLSHGEQRHLEIAIALASKPKLLMLDEPTTGMNPTETDETMKLIKELREAYGVTVLFIEHDMRVVMGISDKVTVMHFGSKIAEGPPEKIKVDKEVIRVYLGEE
ncbi:TPA: ABC transporter ATP-binding protein [Candidatus Bathyarchaeota archaeon]|nr:ABC transporter ATP-binding protein [Candidatus Bathyarchaeota archaeon]